MRRLLLTCLIGATLLTACGDEGGPDVATQATGSTTGTVAPPPSPVSRASPTTKTTATVPERQSPPAPRAEPGTRDAYLARLQGLAAKLGGAIDAAAATGDSTSIARVDRAVARATARWLASGGAASPAAATLAAAIATARTNVESALLAPESRRQLQAARAALAAERDA